ncbi:hypothetical protein [Alicyclobacillus acidiphilus]|uniref:hypothetical protein n=1 Tax=Alicyclobacillus acidiphilus TaxID=182455 RepID=UPI00082F7E03|nr:hypothetical protein [Alicyclobacillus acidiphilus]
MRRSYINMIAWTIVWIGITMLTACVVLRLWMQLVIQLEVPCIAGIICGLILIWVARRFGR